MSESYRNAKKRECFTWNIFCEVFPFGLCIIHFRCNFKFKNGHNKKHFTFICGATKNICFTWNKISFLFFAELFSFCYVSRETVTANCNLIYPRDLVGINAKQPKLFATCASCLFISVNYFENLLWPLPSSAFSYTENSFRCAVHLQESDVPPVDCFAVCFTQRGGYTFAFCTAIPESVSRRHFASGLFSMFVYYFKNLLQR